MLDQTTELPDHQRPRLLIPWLRPFYAVVEPLAWPLVRFGCGWLFVVHGWGKWVRGVEGQAKLFANPAYPLQLAQDYARELSQLLLAVELLGGACVIIGLATRFWAAAMAIEMGVLTFVLYWGNGFSWLNRGYEFTLLWGIVCLAIALRGGGEYSVDKMIGREL